MPFYSCELRSIQRTLLGPIQIQGPVLNSVLAVIKVTYCGERLSECKRTPETSTEVKYAYNVAIQLDQLLFLLIIWDRDSFLNTIKLIPHESQ